MSWFVVEAESEFFMQLWLVFRAQISQAHFLSCLLLEVQHALLGSSRRLGDFLVDLVIKCCLLIVAGFLHFVFFFIILVKLHVVYCF